MSDEEYDISFTTKQWEKHRATRDGHRYFDHSFFPDTAILRVGGRNFIISTSYLALQSPFFNDLFYSENVQNGKYELDADPTIFGDLLDLIYPCYKWANCCAECASSLEDRLNLALRFKLRFAVKRLLKANIKAREGDIKRILQENNAWFNYYSYVSSLKPDIDRSSDGVVAKRDLSDNLERIAVIQTFPDATTVFVRGVTFLVSASTLSLHSKMLANTLYKNVQPVSGVEIDVDPTSFTKFLQFLVGEFAPGVTAEILDDLIRLEAKNLYDFLLDEITFDLMYMEKEEAFRCAIELLQHYSNQSVDLSVVKNIVFYLDKREESVFSECDLSPSVQEFIRETCAEARGIQLFVKTPNGTTTVLDCSSLMPLLMVKKMLADKNNTTIESMWLYYGKSRMDESRTMGDNDIQNNSTVHMGYRLRGC